MINDLGPVIVTCPLFVPGGQITCIFIYPLLSLCRILPWCFTVLHAAATQNTLKSPVSLR